MIDADLVKSLGLASGDARIPASLCGHPVIGIADEAFRVCSRLTSITIPNSVKSIGSGAFTDCSGLTSASIGNGVTSIEDHTFFGCSGLTSITIPDGVTSIGDHAFEGCSGLTSITIPDSVTSIGDFAFSGCDGLTAVSIPDSVKSIGSGAFENDTGLTSIMVGANLESIGYGAFYGCTELTSVAIPNSATIMEGIMEGGIFGACPAIRDVVCPACCELQHVFRDSFHLITNAVLSRDSTSIGPGAFSGFSSLVSITIPDSVTSIGDEAFRACSSLTAITIPDSVTSIEAGAFRNCSGLTAITIPDGVTGIEYDTFSGCSGLSSVTIPNSVTGIEYEAFFGCSGLTSITIPDSVTSIKYSAFSGCSRLTAISIPASLEWESGDWMPQDCQIAVRDEASGTVIIAVRDSFFGSHVIVEECIPTSWVATAASRFVDEAGGDHGLAALATAKNGVNAVWECYVAGLDPESETERFEADIAIGADGAPVVSWTPDLGDERVYTIEGKATLGGAWGEPDEESRFFRVKVALPEEE